MSRQPSSPSSSSHQQPSIIAKDLFTDPTTKERESSVLFLRIYAGPEYFTLNGTLMQQPEPVLVDLILDPFLFNILPRTLVPTVWYIVIVAVGSWVLSTRFIMPWLRALMVSDDERTKAEDKKTQ